MGADWVVLGVAEVSWIGLAFALGFCARTLGLPPLVGYLIAGFVIAGFGGAGDGGAGARVAGLIDGGFPCLWQTEAADSDGRSLDGDQTLLPNGMA